MPAAETRESTKYAFILSFATLLALSAFFFSPPGEILEGNWTILTSPANLITDYFALAGVGAALMNAAVMTYFGFLIILITKVRITGSLIAAIFTLAGFSLFGKNLFNSLPIILGVLFYAQLNKTPFDRYLLQAFYGTAMGPLVSEIAFNLGLPVPLGILLGVLAGILAGFVLPPLSVHFLRFHQGFNLYNIGFTSGIIGMFFIAVLRNFGVEVDTVSLLSDLDNLPFILLLGFLFVAMLVAGLALCDWRPAGLRALMRQSGRLVTDFVTISGFGLTIVNMALLGFISVAYVLIVGGSLNGPVIGGIFTVVGFGAFGKHLRNVIPIFIGVFLMGLFNLYTINSTVALLAALFGTTLAPIAGYYGPFAGILAGILHVAMVMNISYLHAGMNLYNNGFSGGFIAAGLVPIFEELRQMAEIWKKRKSSL